jgi:hypothetical protein
MQLEIQKQTLTKTMATEQTKQRVVKKRKIRWIHVVRYFFYIIFYYFIF